MSRTKRYVQRKAIERMPAPALDLFGKAVVKAVDRAVEERWDRAVRVAAEADGETVDEQVRSIAKRFRRELTTMGAASGAVAAAPGIGTGAAAGALVADLGWFAMRATDLIMAIGAANGHTDSTAEERRAWVLSILAYGEDAAREFSTLLAEIDAGMKVGGQQVSTRLAGLVGGDAAKLDALRRINTSLATTVVSKYGSRRSAVAVGKLLPFGIGAVVGGTANYALIRVVGIQANRFFADYRSLMAVPPPPLPGQRPLAPPAPAALESGAADEPALDAGDWVDAMDAAARGTGQTDGATPIPGRPPMPPPPLRSDERLPNPPARLSDVDRRNSIPTDTAGGEDATVDGP